MRIVTLAAILLASIGAACASHRVAAPSPGHDTFALLADPDTGVVGRATVSTPSGSVDLVADRATTRVTASGPPAAPTIMDTSEVQRTFGEALGVLPPAPQMFVLRFRFDSDELTDEARALATDVVRTVKGRPVPDVVVIGHTDTTGDPGSNFALGLKRAAVVRALLVQGGLDEAAIEVLSLGETDPQVRTPDETAEPLNRRVEIAVR